MGHKEWLHLEPNQITIWIREKAWKLYPLIEDGYIANITKRYKYIVWYVIVCWVSQEEFDELQDNTDHVLWYCNEYARQILKTLMDKVKQDEYNAGLHYKKYPCIPKDTVSRSFYMD